MRSRGRLAAPAEIERSEHATVPDSRLPMYLIDDLGALVDSELSLDVLDGEPCVIVESSGGAKSTKGVARRNPDYVQLISLLLRRLALAQVSIRRIVLDSQKVTDMPVADRIVPLGKSYPLNLGQVDVEWLRKEIGRNVARMHQDAGARSSGNAQKRLRFVLDRPIDAGQLASVAASFSRQDDREEHLPGLSDTERQYLTAARRGQGKFRTDLLNAFHNACPVTGISNPELLVASHIKPWKVCTNRERLDPNNGILLSALFDRLFDRGLITFDDEGRIRASPLLSRIDRKKVRLTDAATIPLSEANRRYMEYHRTWEFKKNA